MELPENIHKLLNSKVHEDRAIGIMLLEEIPDYSKFFDSCDPMVSNSVYLLLRPSKTEYRPITLVITKTSVYWINFIRVYKWSGERDECPWRGGREDKLIII